MRQAILLGSLVLLPPFALHAEDRDLHPPTAAEMTSEARVALVIGNGAYLSGPLRNPPNDAKAVTAKLRELGFDVTLGTDLDYQAMNRALIDFGQKLKAGGVGLFYYAGHGIQSGGHNYLVPVNATIKGEAYLRAEAVDVDLVLAGMAEAHNRVNLVILDACRNNPFERSFRSAGQGLGAPTNTPRGTLIAYATGPGSVAEDGAGAHSAYTQGLLDALDDPGVKVEDLFKTVRAHVEAATGGVQTPWETSSLTGDFYFKIPNSGDVGVAEIAVLRDRDSVEGSRPKDETKREKAPLESLLARYGINLVRIPSGSFKMGSPDNEWGRKADETQHTVKLTRPFLLADKEVPQALWNDVMGMDLARIDHSKDPFPAVNHTWLEAMEFCNRLSQREGIESAYTITGMEVRWNRDANGYRLPTEAEWEYAARAGGSDVYAGTSDTHATCEYGNIGDATLYQKIRNEEYFNENDKVFPCDDGVYQEAPVGRYRPNRWGLFDMTGNVSEWCWDWYGIYPSKRSKDPTGPALGVERVVRGGAWNNRRDQARVAARGWASLDVYVGLTGIRIARWTDR